MCSNNMQQCPDVTDRVLERRSREAELAAAMQRGQCAVHLAFRVASLVDLVDDHATPRSVQDPAVSNAGASRARLVVAAPDEASARNQHVHEPRLNTAHGPLPGAGLRWEHLDLKRPPTRQLPSPILQKCRRAQHQHRAQGVFPPALIRGCLVLRRHGIQTCGQTTSHLHRLAQTHLVGEQTTSILDVQSLVHPPDPVALILAQASGDSLRQHCTPGQLERSIRPAYTPPILWSRESLQTGPTTKHVKWFSGGRAGFRLHSQQSLLGCHGNLLIRCPCGLHPPSFDWRRRGRAQGPQVCDCSCMTIVRGHGLRECGGNSRGNKVGGGHVQRIGRQAMHWRIIAKFMLKCQRWCLGNKANLGLRVAAARLEQAQCPAATAGPLTLSRCLFRRRCYRHCPLGQERWGLARHLRCPQEQRGTASFQ
mmetsp:Transcript_16479/g.57627  ORF Transcript_16479/g.57627 Transcript_16479/m.57627 type:complete len:423 (-) Transcript_16479:365-1633(-)